MTPPQQQQPAGQGQYHRATPQPPRQNFLAPDMHHDYFVRTAPNGTTFKEFFGPAREPGDDMPAVEEEMAARPQREVGPLFRHGRWDGAFGPNDRNMPGPRTSEAEGLGRDGSSALRLMTRQLAASADQ